MILHPLAQVLIYALVLSQIMKAKLPGIESQYGYPIYLLAGMAGWTLFSEVLGRFINIFIENANLLKKISFPKLSLPLIGVGSSMLNFSLLLLATDIVFGFLGHFPLKAAIWLPLPILITLGIAVGLGLFLGTLNVFIRDIGQFMTIVMNFWFWLTPVVYMPSIIPQKYHFILAANPMTAIIISYQNIMVYNKMPDLSSLIYPSLFAFVCLILALIVFKKANEEMTDVL